MQSKKLPMTVDGQHGRCSVAGLFGGSSEGDRRVARGDGQPGISRQQAQQQIAAESVRFMDGLASIG